MAVIKNRSTSEGREFWSHVEAVAKEVESWPHWMGNLRGEDGEAESRRPRGGDGQKKSPKEK